MGNRPAAVDLVSEERAFRQAWPDYETTSALDGLRAGEFARLDAEGHVYLDYTGGGLYGESQLRRHLDLLRSHVLGNPHSANPASLVSTGLVEAARRHVLSNFRASPDEYCVIFTANASHALKLVGESYPFAPRGRFLLTFDNHNSVNGIREFARARGAETRYIPVLPPDMRADPAALLSALDERDAAAPSLVAYPAQSNFSGVQHPLEWIAAAQERGWDVLLDAAAFVPTNQLDLSRCHPDFVALSFYKMFGHPTGVGALVARRAALEKLHRPWFSGGTITVASVGADRHVPAPGASAFEDGTLDYGNLPAVDIGLEFVEAAGLDVIHRRLRALTGWLLDRLLGFRHRTGRSLVTLYGPATLEARGATLAFNFHDASGGFIDHQGIEARAGERRISLRSGCFCNPGAGELALGLSPQMMSNCFALSPERMTYADFRRCVDGGSSGAVRISLGIASNFADAFAFVSFAREFLL